MATALQVTANSKNPDSLADLLNGAPNAESLESQQAEGEASGANHRFGQFSRSAFFARHNPHPSRVRHMKGLLDCPVCIVNDDGYEFDKYVWRDMHSHQDLPGTSFPPKYFSENVLTNHKHQPSQYSSMPQLAQQRMPVFAINLGNVHQKLNPDTLRGLQNFTGLQNYSFKEKADPLLGLAPITGNWRQELRALTEAAMQAIQDKRKQEALEKEDQAQGSLKHPATWLRGGANLPATPSSQRYSQSSGRLITATLQRPTTTPRPRSVFGEMNVNNRPMTNREVIETRALPMSRPNTSSRGYSRNGEQGYYEHQSVATPQGAYDHIFHAHDPEVEIFAMLCGILQTDDTNAVRAWLSSASEREKTLMLEIVRASLLNREDYYSNNGRDTLAAIVERDEAPQGVVNSKSKADVTEVNRLLVHVDNGGSDSLSQQQKFTENQPTNGSGDIYRPSSPLKYPQKATDVAGGNRRQSKRSSAIKTIPQPLWRPESSLVN